MYTEIWPDHLHVVLQSTYNLRSPLCNRLSNHSTIVLTSYRENSQNSLSCRMDKACWNLWCIQCMPYRGRNRIHNSWLGRALKVPASILDTRVELYWVAYLPARSHSHLDGWPSWIKMTQCLYLNTCIFSSYPSTVLVCVLSDPAIPTNFYN